MPAFPPPRRIAFSRSGIARWMLWITAPLVALASLRFAALPVELANDQLAHHALARPLAFYVHVFGAAVALLLAPVQLSGRLRARRPGLHRVSGRVSVAAMAAGGISGIALALHAQAGPVAQTGFALLGVLWIAAASLGVAAALRRDFAAHRAWMVRAAAMTIGAITLRLQLPVGFALGYEYNEAVQLIAWTCWVPNLLVAEWWLRRGAAPRGLPA